MRRVIALALIGAATLAIAGCNRRVFERVKPTCDQTIASDVDIPAEKASDILIVVDNSGSMQEEQTRLGEAFINDSPNCPINKNDLKDFARCDEADPPAVCAFANPALELLNAPGPEGLADCGFIQVLAAFENDFRIGVITTDVGVCDNRFPSGQSEPLLCDPLPPCTGTPPSCAGGLVCNARTESCERPACTDPADCTGGLVCNAGRCERSQLPPECTNPDPGNGWGFRPQRGCLQPDGPPGLPGTTLKVISRQDLLDADDTNDDIGDRFSNTLKNIRVFGSPVERGLDAATMFLDPATDRDASCAGDLDSFLRKDAKLIVIFLTDEEDCSRAPDVAACPDGQTCGGCDSETGCEIFGCAAGAECTPGFTEFRGETCGLYPEHFTDVIGSASRCYELEASLTPVSHYVEALKALKTDPNDVSVAVIAGGLPNAAGEVGAAGCAFDSGTGQPIGGCIEKRGASNTCRADENCCFADPGGRYYDLATGLNGLKDTICVDSFNQTMIKIAVFIGDVDFLKLAERPADPALVFVEKAPASSQDFALVGRLGGTTCGSGNGWVLEEDGVTVRFCGDARPGPGERVRVRAKGQGAESDAPDACVTRGDN
jgi:hypothetical protein